MKISKKWEYLGQLNPSSVQNEIKKWCYVLDSSSISIYKIQLADSSFYKGESLIKLKAAFKILSVLVTYSWEDGMRKGKFRLRHQIEKESRLSSFSCFFHE